MELIFDSNYNRNVGEEYRRFIETGDTDLKTVRPEILDLWVKYRDAGYEPENMIPTYLSREEIEKKIEENKLMCDIAKPFMKNMFDSIPGKSSLVTLLDKNGTVLLHIDSGDNKFISSSTTRPGAVTTPPVSGCPELDLCFSTSKPAWCYGEENYMVASKPWTCAAAPILDEDGNIEGVITISDKTESVHYHTMGMVLSAAKAIGDEMLLYKKNELNLNLANRLSATIESTPQGMIIVDSTGNIDFMNHYAKSILNIKESDPVNHYINEFIEDQQGIFALDHLPGINEQEFIIKSGNNTKRVFITIKQFIVHNDSSEPDWSLIILKEATQVKKLVNEITNASSHFSFSDIKGVSPAIKSTIQIANIAAGSTSNVLITGPSGTGKELFAHAIHSASERSNGPFISINCGALPSGLVESELFGYESGAFTGAKKEGQVGKFELANHGTIFLDEIGEMPLAVQASILRVIETREVTRIGSSTTNLVDVRIIAATNRDLQSAIENKEFREDLYYRLNVLRLNIPPLIKRKEDIPVLADYFLDEYMDKLNKPGITLSPDAYTSLVQYNYPGNIRELENIIERTVNICDPDSVITPSILRLFVSLDTNSYESVAPETSKASGESTMLKDMERDLIIETLKKTNGSVTKAADMLGIGRRTIYRKFEEYNIDHTSFRRRGQ